MLDQMQNMFENMQSAENAEESPAERALQKQIDELGKLLHDQQAPRDDTFRSDQRDQKRRRGAAGRGRTTKKAGAAGRRVSPNSARATRARNRTGTMPARTTRSSATGNRR